MPDNAVVSHQDYTLQILYILECIWQFNFHTIVTLVFIHVSKIRV